MTPVPVIDMPPSLTFILAPLGVPAHVDHRAADRAAFVFASTMRGEDQDSQAEVALWIAVVEQAIQDVQKGGANAGPARAWLWETGMSRCVGSFEWIAGAMNADPNMLRRMLLKRIRGNRRTQIRVR